MSNFNQILSLRNVRKHDSRALWKYGLTQAEFLHLKKALIESRFLKNVDPRDCTLYYAEWWKRCYDGGFPSKKDVFDSISNLQFYNEEEFFQVAKKGANLLGIIWIKNQNTLYFRTLLLQGGLPIKHLSNHKGTYKSFLLKILELNPNTIDDFAFDSKITSLLPSSSRNDEVFECCLEIVKAIINEDKEYLTILDNHEELKEISNALRIKKQNLNFGRKKTRFRISWVFEPINEKIRLYLRIPEMDSDSFREAFLNDETDLDFEYKLYYDNRILCKLVRKTNSQYRVVWINDGDLYWNGTDQLADLYITDSKGNKSDCAHLITHLPKLDEPTLWTKYSDAQWVLEKGRHTNQEEAFALIPNNYASNIVVDAAEVRICNRTYKWVAFKKEIILSNDIEQKHIHFNASSKNFQWFIRDEKPSWMQSASLPIVRRKPRVIVFDESGNNVQGFTWKWRQKPNSNWNNSSIPVSRGLIELQIQLGDVLEYDEIFNLEDLHIKIESNSLHIAEIELTNDIFLFNINESPLVEIKRINSNRIALQLKSNTSLPDAIQASLKVNNQNKGLRFQLFPPFKGVEIIDCNQKIVPNEASFALTNLYGYRLMSNMPNLVVNIYNSRRKHIIISERLVEKFLPLRTFEDKINQLYTLSDSADGDAEIILEVWEENSFNQTKIREYRVNRYCQKIKWHKAQNERFVVEGQDLSLDLYAVPVDCTADELNLYDLEVDEGRYVFREVPKSKNIVVFCKDSEAKIPPVFISLDHEDNPIKQEDRVEKIIHLRDQLLNSAFDKEVWQRFLGYYKICLNNDLPFSTFEILKTVGYSSELAARCFVFLMCYDDSLTFVEDSYKKIEQDLGFSFHWANKGHWEKSMSWIGCDSDLELMKIVGSGIKRYFDSLQPNSQFTQIANYVMQNQIPKIHEGYFLNGRILNLRTSLGRRVLNELPQKCPKVPESYKKILPVNDMNASVKILLKSPLAVALSIAGKDDGLWDRDDEYVRRNVKYTHQINPEWYSEAINYCLTKL